MFEDLDAVFCVWYFVFGQWSVVIGPWSVGRMQRESRDAMDCVAEFSAQQFKECKEWYWGPSVLVGRKPVCYDTRTLGVSFNG